MGRKPTTFSNKTPKKTNQPQTISILSKSKLKQKSSKAQNPTTMPNDWNNNTILAKIFDQMEFKDVINANSVCRQWHQLTNSKIYHSLKLLRYHYVQRGYHLGKNKPKKLRNMEVMACIENNAKHSELVKNVNLNFTIDVATIKHLFSTFCHLSQLEFNIYMTQDLILSCLRHLRNLVSLTFRHVRVRKIVQKRFEFSIVQLPTTLKTLKFIRLSYYGLPNLFKESMVTHTNLEEFVCEGFIETDLISPFVTSYSTLKRLTLKERYGMDLKDKAQEIIRSNPQLTELTFHSDSVNYNAIKLINTNLPNLQTLNYGNFIYTPSDTPPDTLTNIQFSKRMNLTMLALHSNRLSNDLHVSLLNKTPNLKKLTITIDDDYKKITSIIHRNLPNLEHLTYFNAYSTWNNFDQELKTKFISNEINNSQYACANRLKSLSFGDFDILTLDPSYLERFPNLEVIQFTYSVYFNRRLEIRKLVKHLKKFVGWKFEFMKPYYREGYLYKNNQAIPKEPLSTQYIYH